MKPLIAITVFNRAEETRRTLSSLADTGAIDDAEIVIFDNDSEDGAGDVVLSMLEKGKLGPSAQAIYSPRNIGCPRALNQIMAEHRQPGQDLIKVDNDVVFHTNRWVQRLVALAGAVKGLALLSGYYHNVFEGRQVKNRGDWHEVFPVVGHCVYHAGWFLDEVGFFDVLSDDHLYGFEDLLMCHRAIRRGYKCGVHGSVFVKMIQRHNALDVAKAKFDPEAEDRKAHVDRLRSLYNARVRLAAALEEHYYVDEAGLIKPMEG